MSLDFQLFTSFISVISMGPFDKRLSQADGLVKPRKPAPGTHLTSGNIGQNKWK